MEVKKSHKADLERRRPLFFAIAIAAVTALFCAVLLVPFRSLGGLIDNAFDDYTVDLDFKLREKERMVPAEVTQQERERNEVGRLNKVDDAAAAPPEEIDDLLPPQEAADEEPPQEEEPSVVMEKPDVEALRVVEELPEYPGGMSQFVKWLTATLKYPAKALAQKQRGRVMISFIVERDGTLTDMKVEQSAGKLLDDEAMRVARLMPKWKPGKEKGQPCRTRVAIPIVFDL